MTPLPAISSRNICQRIGEFPSAEIDVEWKALWPNQPRELCEIAWELMLCAAYPNKDHNKLSPERIVKRLRCALLSLEVARDALASGFLGGIGRAL
jgi:hypothetical protein